MKISLYYHAIKHLKYSQIFWRMVRKIYRPRVSQVISSVKKKSFPATWCFSILRTTRFFQHDHIILLNESLALTPQLWQESQNKSKLWRYHLHYFECLLSEHAEDILLGKRLLQEWLYSCPPYTQDAWEPYPISLRLVYLIKFQLNGGELSHEVLESLYLQARYLYKIPEYHLLGNHLFENAKALIFAGLFFEGEEPNQWFKWGQKILNREIPEQILNDGGHFELSPMYHSIILEGLLDLYNLYCAAGLAFPLLWKEKTSAMRFWLQVMTHPDGEISFFNDSALGVAPSRDKLEAYALLLNFKELPALSQPITLLPDSGYIRLQNKAAVVLIDCARVGPDYLPGHAHADTLSFELSLLNQRTLVNSGTSSYQDLPLRLFQRSTAAHTTVEIDHCNSSAVFGAFRVGRRAYPLNVESYLEAGKMVVRAGHTGYQHTLSCTHFRSWVLSDTQLEIQDTVMPLSPKASKLLAVARFFIHPHLQVSTGKRGEIVLSNAQLISSVPAHIQSANYYPQFGCVQSTQVIECPFEQTCTVCFSWI